MIIARPRYIKRRQAEPQRLGQVRQKFTLKAPDPDMHKFGAGALRGRLARAHDRLNNDRHGILLHRRCHGHAVFYRDRQGPDDRLVLRIKLVCRMFPQLAHPHHGAIGGPDIDLVIAVERTCPAGEIVGNSNPIHGAQAEDSIILTGQASLLINKPIFLLDKPGSNGLTFFSHDQAINALHNPPNRHPEHRKARNRKDRCNQTKIARRETCFGRIFILHCWRLGCPQCSG